MIETIAGAAVVGYLVLGVAARLFVNVDRDYDFNDEAIPLSLWIVATPVAAIAMIVLGASPPDIIVATVVALAVGVPAFYFLHYSVWGAHLASLDNKLGWFGGIWFLINWVVAPVVLSVSVLVLAARVVDAIDEAVVLGIVVALGAIALIGAIALLREGRKLDREWLRKADAAAAADPEVADALRAAGWRVDGPFSEMEAIYRQTLGEVNTARRDAGVPVFEGVPGRLAVASWRDAGG